MVVSIEVLGVTDGLMKFVNSVLPFGIERNSRNGETLSFPPMFTSFKYPRMRVLRVFERRENPYLHLIDSALTWARVPNASLMCRLFPRFKSYSNSIQVFEGHYGTALCPQIPDLLKVLQASPDTRRAYAPFFMSRDDRTTSLDIPCNVGVQFYIENNCLNLQVFNRSHDLFWGLFGANMPQFSTLLELVANELQIDLGSLSFFSTLPHVYTKQGPYPRHKDFRFLDGAYRETNVFGAKFTSFSIDATDCVLEERKSFKTAFFQEMIRPAIECVLTKKKFLDCPDPVWRTAFEHYHNS